MDGAGGPMICKVWWDSKNAGDRVNNQLQNRPLYFHSNFQNFQAKSIYLVKLFGGPEKIISSIINKLDISFGTNWRIIWSIK